MKFLILNIFILIAADIVYTKYVPRDSTTPLPKLSDVFQTSPNYEYREVILYLKPSEVEAMKKDINVLNEHLQMQHSLKFIENNNSSYTQENEDILPKNNDILTIIKPIYEPQAELESLNAKQENKTKTPISYPKDTIMKNENAENEDIQNIKYVYIDVKKMEEDKLREQRKKPSMPTASKPKEQEMKTLLPQDNPLSMFQPAYNLQNMPNIKDLQRLYEERELEKQATIIYMKQIANSPPIIYRTEVKRNRPVPLANLYTPQIFSPPESAKNEYSKMRNAPRYVLKPIPAIMPDNVHINNALTALDILGIKPMFDNKKKQK